jgi:hypothetical protein
MTDQASFNDGGFRVDHRCELATILSLQVLDGLSAPESRIQAVRESADAGVPTNRNLKDCCDPSLNHARKCISFNALRLSFRLVASGFAGIFAFSTAIDLAL